MSTDPKSPQAPAEPALLRWLADKPKQTAYALLGLALVLAVLTIVTAIWWESDLKLAVVVFGVIAVLTCLGSGLHRLLYRPKEGAETDVNRLLILTVGGMMGLGLFLAGLVLGYLRWDSVLRWLDTDGPPPDQRWQAGMVLTVIILGLATMFLSLQMGRTQERSSVVLRRLLYAYNAGLTALLLLAILVVVNVLVSVAQIGTFRLRQPFDFTASGQFSLSPRSESILRNLRKPVEITNVTGYRDLGLDENVRALLTACRAVTDRIKVRELMPHIDRQEAQELAEKYPDLERGSLLVVYDPGGRQQHAQVIKSSDMTTFPSRFDPSGPSTPQFTGEDALMTALSFMAEDRKKPVVYFTQDHQELDLTDFSSQQPGQGGASFKSQLEKRNYEVKALKLSPLEPKIPDDAALVVIAGPTQPILPGAVQALTEYMNNRKGKLLILLNATPGKDKTFEKTGLEDFLKTYGIEVKAERLLTLPTLNYQVPPNIVVGGMNRRLGENPVVRSFANHRFVFENARVLELSSAAGTSSFLAQPLMQTRTFSFAEANAATPPSRIIEDLMRNRDALNKLVERIESQEPLPLVVGVSESGFDPSDPHAAMRGPQPRKPRMVVFAASSLASNAYVSEDSGTYNFDLLASCIEWLREREGNIGIPPKVNTTFALQPRTSTEVFRMIFLPPILVVASVLGLATGVWVVRRR